jgi:HAD superfamily hydrolase (TIGR01458 family)
MALPQHISGLLIDIDGTIIEGESMIPGSDRLLARLRETKTPFRLVTNITSKPISAILSKLKGLGVEVEPDEIFTAPVIAREYLLQHGLARCYPLFKTALQEDFEGVDFVEESPQAVLVGDMGDDLNYEKLNRAFRFILEGAAFLTLARNRYFRGKDGLCLDVGATVAALEYATQREATLLGKPSQEFFDLARQSMGGAARDTLVIGDDLEADVGGAQAAGYAGVLVKTGKFRQAQLDRSTIRPDAILDSLAHFSELGRLS